MTSENDAVSTPPRAFSPLIWLVFLAIVNLIGPFLPIPNAPTAFGATIALTLLYIGAVVAFALGVARLKLSIPIALAFLGVSALVWLLVERGLFPLVTETARALRAAKTPPSSAQILGFVATETLQDLALFCGATFAGTLIARLIRHPNMIGPIGAAIALIDIWGVLFGGIVSQLMANQATQTLTAKAMSAGPKLGGASAAKTGFSVAIPSIGVGDFLFIALLLSVLVNLSMNWRTSARLMWIFSSAALLAIAFNLSIWWPATLFPLTWELVGVSALPGLLFIGAGAVLPNWKYFTFTRDERFALLYAGIFVVILTVGLYFGFKSLLPTK